MRCQRLSALARLISLRCLFLDAAAAFFNPPSLPILRMKSGVNLMMMRRRLTTPQSTLCRGARRPWTRASASVSSNATSFDPGRAEQAVQAELPKPSRWLQANDLSRISRRQSRNVIDGFERYPKRREASSQDRAQIVGRAANSEWLLGHRFPARLDASHLRPRPPSPANCGHSADTATLDAACVLEAVS